MANENEPAKLLLPYLQRADELQSHDPLVAYYCRLYAMERGLKFPQTERTKTTNNLLVSLMKQLEKDKKTLKLGPDDQLHLEGFALNVFEKADKQDRAGRANLNTAKTFYAASIFFEILNQFGELQPDLEQKQKYAAWKAADIRKAIKEGRTPVAGPPGGEDNFSIPATASGEYDVEPSRPDLKSAPVHPPPQFYDEVHPQHTPDILPSPTNNTSPPPPPPTYSTSNYPSHDIYPSQNNRSEDSSYHQTYHHQAYPQEPHQQLPQNYPSHGDPSHSLPNFQSYPSFSESSLPTAPSHYPTYHQPSDSSYPNPDQAPYNSQNSFGTPHHEPSKPSQHIYTQGSYDSVPAPIQTFQYDSNYEPTPEKIAEAHKAARFAVGALAFDDVATAVDFLKKSLELLTVPAAGH